MNNAQNSISLKNKILNIFKKKNDTEKKNFMTNARDTVLWILAFTVFEFFFFQPFYIPSGSMIPTLAIGDEIIVEKFAYGFSGYSYPLPFFQPGHIGGFTWAKPKIGDVVVFRNTANDKKEDYIKRVVGLPGDRIQVKRGVLYYNGKKLTDYQVPLIDEMNTKDYGMGVHDSYYIEDINGVKHFTEKDSMQGSANNTPEFVVPDGMFFAMGDNRDHSSDSRFQSLKYVPLQNLIGKAEFIAVSAKPSNSPFGILSYPLRIRWDRIFKRIN